MNDKIVGVVKDPKYQCGALDDLFINREANQNLSNVSQTRSHIEPTSKGGSKSERTRRRAERKARLPPATNRRSLRDAKSLANKIQSC